MAESNPIDPLKPFDPKKEITGREVEDIMEALKIEREKNIKRSIRTFFFTFLIAIVVAIILSSKAYGKTEEYVCNKDVPGTTNDCSAVATGPDGPTVVWFRRGDIIDADRGWVVHPNEGWELLDLAEAPVIYPSMVGL